MAKSTPTVVANRYVRELKRTNKSNIVEGKRVIQSRNDWKRKKSDEVLVESYKKGIPKPGNYLCGSARKMIFAEIHAPAKRAR